MEFTAQQIAGFLNGTIEGNPNTKVTAFSKIEDGKPGSLTFLANPKYEHHIYHSEASIVLVNNDFIPSAPIKATLVKVANAYVSLAILLDRVEQLKKKKEGIDSTAFIDVSAHIGNNCYVGNFAYIGENVKVGTRCKIYPHVYIADNVSIGDDCIIYPHVTVYEGCIIGNNCILHAGAVIGSDGFGFAPEGDTYKKIPQLGNVILEDDIEVGANTAIDRAVMDATIIRKGVKLDNLVQIAHNVEVGEHTVMAAQVGVAGSVKIGKHCQFGGQAGLAGHIHIQDNVSIGAQAGVIGNIESGRAILGSPAIDVKSFLRSSAVFSRLPDMYRTLGQLQREIEQLKSDINKKDN
ncbi:MAG: UDP-3-O-(3-hydroxymyristoyl)glucosamine N-acyltransferase [Tannerellaceae bacterium]|jgi:UDP-3-O-[3-hydroxymyristoyl] glucosamine N-acyltransferase|nr:UDP-3-O-(3-hydroxymyristoyl)glucosamine N-acyltransferase [Tannerellaceae bacterium]